MRARQSGNIVKVKALVLELLSLLEWKPKDKIQLESLFTVWELYLKDILKKLCCFTALNATGEIEEEKLFMKCQVSVAQ